MPRIVDVEERRAELAEAAARVIARAGITGASMREVAAEAGWTTGTLAHYFGNKHELLTFTLEASLERRRARRADRNDLSPDDALYQTLRGALPLDESGRLHWVVTVAFCAQATTDPSLAALQRDAYRDFRDTVAELVVAARRTHAGVLAGTVAARDEAERLIAVVDGVAIQALFDPDSWPADRQLRMLDAALGRVR